MSRNEIDALIEQNNVELEALRRDMAERRQRTRSEENLAWAKARNEQRAEAERQAQAEPPRIQQSAEAKPMTQPTDGWVRYIKQQTDSNQRAMEGAIADLLGPIEKKHKAALDEVRTEVAALRNELAECRAEAKVRGAIDDVQARLDKIEQTTPRPALKAVTV